MNNTSSIFEVAQELGLKSFEDLIQAREMTVELEKATKFNQKMAVAFAVNVFEVDENAD